MSQREPDPGPCQSMMALCLAVAAICALYGAAMLGG